MNKKSKNHFVTRRNWINEESLPNKDPRGTT